MRYALPALATIAGVALQIAGAAAILKGGLDFPAGVVCFAAGVITYCGTSRIARNLNDRDLTR